MTTSFTAQNHTTEFILSRSICFQIISTKKTFYFINSKEYMLIKIIKAGLP